MRYINHGTLTNAYFDAADATLGHQLVSGRVQYGSAASEMISVFTRKQFNHVSLAFDRDLETIISYNGGDNVYPPGMNARNSGVLPSEGGRVSAGLQFAVTAAQKEFVIDKIDEINREGSAYNMLRLASSVPLSPTSCSVPNSSIKCSRWRGSLL